MIRDSFRVICVLVLVMLFAPCCGLYCTNLLTVYFLIFHQCVWYVMPVLTAPP